MSKPDQKKILLGASCMFFCALLVGFFSFGNMANPALDTNAETLVEGDGDAEVYLQLLSEFKDYQQYLGIDSSSVSVTQLTNFKNPFEKPRKQVSKSEKKPAARRSNLGKARPLRLSGVLWDEHEPSVIINGKVVKQGGYIAGCRIDKILPTKAVLKRGKKKFTLKLPKNKK